MHRGYSHWPARTRVIDDDVVVAGESLRERVDLAGTPTILEPLGEDVPPVLVSQVLAVDCHASGRTVVLLDCRLDDLPFVWSDARLFSRTSRARTTLCLVVRRPGREDITRTNDVIAMRLPADIRMGDLVALPGRTLQPSGALGLGLS